MNLPTWYSTGSVSVESGSTTVSGSGVLWGTGGTDDNIMVGDLFSVPSEPMVPAIPIASVSADGDLELLWAWPGADVTAQPYIIRYVGIIERSTRANRMALERMGEISAWYDVIVETDADRLALETAGSPLRAGYRVLVKADGVIWAKETSTYGAWIGPVEFKGDKGEKGWSPVYGLVEDGERRVEQLVEWVGGTGTAPTASVGKYRGSTGLVDDIEDATDVRGPAGDIDGVTPYWQERLTQDADAEEALGGLGVTSFWQDRLTADADQVDALTALGAASSNDPVLTGAVRIATDGGDISITGDSTPFTPDRAFYTIYNDDVRDFTLRVTSTWEGEAGSAFNNNDSVLSEVRNRVLSDSANQSWAVSAANAYNDIPVGVVDSGMRVGVLGWAVSVNIAGYTHAGRLNEQYGVWGRAGFQGGGAFQSPSTARLNRAVGVRGEIATESPNARMDVAIAGLFESVCANAQIDDNYAVYARASGATTTNYSFWGEAGKIRNKGDIEIVSGATAGVLFNSGTNVGFATNLAKSAGQYMTVNGSTWTSLSDARIKTDVETVSVLDKLDQFRAVTYTNLLTGIEEFGVIAQEMAQCFPEFVVQGNDDPECVPTGIDDAGMWKVTGYERMGAYALQGVKELLQLVRDLQDEVVSLRAAQKSH